MKAKTLLLLILFASAATINAFGQISFCTNPTNKLVCLFPLNSSNLTPQGSAASVNAAQGVAQSINASIASQLSQLPIPSATVGAISLRKAGSDFGVPYDNLGPVLTDRPDTVGRGHLYAGFSYQHFSFNAIDGIGLGAVPVGYTYKQPGASGVTQTVFGNSVSDIHFHMDQYVALVTYGATRTTDISVIIPINDVSLGATSSKFVSWIYDPASIADPWTSTSQAGTVQSNGTASGIGDVTVSLKQLIHGAEDRKTGVAPDRLAVSIGGAVRFPTGDSLNYLGSGSWGLNIYGLLEYRRKLSPHLKVSNQTNGVSQIVNPQPTTAITLPGGLQYDAGADYRAHRKLTIAVDLLGSEFYKAPSLSSSTLLLTPVVSGSGAPASLASVNSVNNTYTTVHLSTGIKWQPVKGLLVYANVLTQLNNVGLRSDPVPLFGISYNMKTRK